MKGQTLAETIADTEIGLESSDEVFSGAWSRHVANLDQHINDS